MISVIFLLVLVLVLVALVLIFLLWSSLAQAHDSRRFSCDAFPVIMPGFIYTISFIPSLFALWFIKHPLLIFLISIFLWFISLLIISYILIASIPKRIYALFVALVVLFFSSVVQIFSFRHTIHQPLSVVLFAYFNEYPSHDPSAMVLTIGLLGKLDFTIMFGIIVGIFTTPLDKEQVPPRWYWTGIVLRWNRIIFFPLFRRKTLLSKLFCLDDSTQRYVDTIIWYTKILCPIQDHASFWHQSQLLTAVQILDFFDSHPSVLSPQEKRHYQNDLMGHLRFCSTQSAVPHNLFSQAEMIRQQIAVSSQ